MMQILHLLGRRFLPEPLQFCTQRMGWRWIYIYRYLCWVGACSYVCNRLHIVISWKYEAFVLLVFFRLTWGTTRCCDGDFCNFEAHLHDRLSASAGEQYRMYVVRGCTHLSTTSYSKALLSPCDFTLSHLEFQCMCRVLASGLYALFFSLIELTDIHFCLYQLLYRLAGLLSILPPAWFGRISV